MSFEDEFDDIIREKSDELNYPFDEKNWDKASALIDAERTAAVPRGLKKKLYLPALAVLLVASAVTVGIVYKPTATPAEKTVAVNETKTSGLKETAIAETNTDATHNIANIHTTNPAPHVAANAAMP